MSVFLKEFQERGFLYQCTNLEGLKALSSEKKIVAYIGFDCTAKSLHVGNLMQIMALRIVQQHGHKPIILIGGATSIIGDPTGKDTARPQMSKKILSENIIGIQKSLSKFIKFGNGPSDALLVNNATWLNKIKYLEFLRDYGSVISVNKMLAMDSAKSRLDRGTHLSFLEFNYMLLQGYDFAHLYNTHQCMLQIGGSDQWGNIVFGTEITRKKYSREVFGLTTPLLTTSSGAKMGKTVNGAVWINEDMLSPYDYYQYWRNIEDTAVVHIARLYAEFDHHKMHQFLELTAKDINAAKKELAFVLTALCHGEASATESAETARQIFEERNTTIQRSDLSTMTITQDQLGMLISDLVLLSGLSLSKSNARRLVVQGGVYINNTRITDINYKVTIVDFDKNTMQLSKGKTQHIVIKLKTIE